MTLTLHPETTDFAELLAFEYALMSPPVDGDDYEAWYRGKWHAIATGEVTPRHMWECGVGVEATALYVEDELRSALAGSPEWLETVLRWLATWLSDRRKAQS